MPEKPQKGAIAKAAWETSIKQCLPELLVNVYSCCVMVKSVSYCFVHKSWLFSYLVTYVAKLSIRQHAKCYNLCREHKKVINYILYNWFKEFMNISVKNLK